MRRRESRRCGWSVRQTRDTLSICRASRLANLESVAVADYSAISYVDQQVGRLLDALDDAGVADLTAVLFMGDQ